VLVLGDGEDGVSLEDFVDAGVLLDGLDQLLKRRNVTEDRLAVEDLPTVGRAPFLDRWCRERGVELSKDKAALAQDVLDTGRERGRLVQGERRDQLRELHKQLLRATAPPAKS